jgi:hypothetical protein
MGPLATQVSKLVPHCCEPCRQTVDIRRWSWPSEKEWVLSKEWVLTKMRRPREARAPRACYSWQVRLRI